MTDVLRQNKMIDQKKLKIILFRAVISISILSILFYFISFEGFIAALKSVPFATWAIILTAFIAGHTISALKWRLVIGTSGVFIPIQLAIRAHAGGLFANICLPSIIGGDVIRAGMACKDQGKIEAIAVGSLMDRLNDTIALILIASIASIFISQGITPEVKQAFTLIAAIIIISVIIGLVILKQVPAAKYPRPMISIINKIQFSMNSLMSKPRAAVFAFCLSLMVQSIFVALNIILANAIGINIEAAIWFWAWPLAKLIALLPISLGGIGVREAALAGLLTPFGVETTLAVSQGISWQAVLISTGLISGFFVLISKVKES